MHTKTFLAQANLVVAKCRINNDASIDISSSGELLACLVPVHSSSPSTSVNLSVHSLSASSLGQCLYAWTFSANAVSVSLSPLGRYVVVGLNTSRSPLLYVYPGIAGEPVTIAQVFRLHSSGGIGPESKLNSCFQHVRNMQVERGEESFNLNSIRWLPCSGEGLIYGTNRGHLVICRPSPKEADEKDNSKEFRSTTGTQTGLEQVTTRRGTLSIGTQTSEAALQMEEETEEEDMETSSDEEDI